MRILQNTTDFSNQQIREMINFAKPNNLPTSKFDVRVTHCTGSPSAGYAMLARERPAIVLRVVKNEKNKFPYYSDFKPEIRRP